MKVSREQMAENRTRILDAASRMFREKGFDAVSVAAVMQAAGLTHGGFYGHFTSKDDLFAKSLDHVLATKADPGPGFDEFVRAYISPAHRDDPGQGCPTAALASEARLQSPEAREALTAGLRAQVERLAQALPGESPADQRRAAMGVWSAMVGALILSRAVNDPALSEDILAQTRAWIEDGASH